ncbi:MAG: hypothetical protein K9M98_13375 [Cephaloticoccus sp.]|nr:hypothetical protein [Cephaloticoccus sp.]MCF7761483.1 hypothetical protein [Cephaloticoccus sp.]
MPKPSALLLGLLLGSGFLAGCHGWGKSDHANRFDRPANVPTAFEQQQARDSYIESHYEQHLKAGRVANADEARALAAHDWEAYERHRSGQDASTVRWSSADAAKREQRKFEQELAEMEQK